MPLNKELIDILACPSARDPSLAPGRVGLRVPVCKLAYLVVDDIPNFIVEEAQALQRAQAVGRGQPRHWAGRRTQADRPFFCGLAGRNYVRCCEGSTANGRGASADSTRPAVFAVKKALGRQVQLCQAEDIAPSGIIHQAPARECGGAPGEVELAFALPGSREEIAARGLVVNDVIAGGFRRTGVRFIALRPEHAQLIAGYCRRR